MVKVKKEHAPKCQIDPCTCDGYHTFDELYEHRLVLWIALCRQIAWHGGVWLNNVWRSRIHSDGSKYDGWFVLGIGKSEGLQITYHLPMSKWDETGFAETLEKAPNFDGHTSDDILVRLQQL